MKKVLLSGIIAGIFLISIITYSSLPQQKQVEPEAQSNYCSGTAACFTGNVTKIVDGDTIHVNGNSIRFALASTPELDEFGGLDAKHFVEQICPVGSEALVDEDDRQTLGSYGRMIAVIYCNGVNLNESVLDADHAWLPSAFCSRSEFSTHAWAQKYGC
ncbi:hypothetical protein LCGC14_2714100 [marine sediment metagenome]|uniref:TNase-like domain-containing protein n=1 Tax=marine sediment metagenome TaxID=412755 RepID=A0A0F9BL36_9ZZZZ|nr:thermonuclease family protein [Nitrosopumilus sp.]